MAETTSPTDPTKPNPPPGPPSRPGGHGKKGEAHVSPKPSTVAVASGLEPVAGGGGNASGSAPSISNASASAPAASSKQMTSSSDPKGGRSRISEERKAQRAAAFKVKTEKLRLALWPTSEAVNQMKKDALVSEIDYRRLFDSARFSSEWEKFSRNQKPTTRAKDELKQLARDILVRRAGVRARRADKKSEDAQASSSKTKDDSAKGDAKEKNAKRKVRSLSVENPDLTAKFANLSKIPKKNESTEPQSEAEKTHQEMRDLEGGGADDEVLDFLEDEDDEPVITSEVIQNTYAAAAAQGAPTRENNPFILYVHETLEMRKTMSREAWKVVLESFNEICVEQLINSKPSPNIDWNGFKQGVGFLAPADEDSQKLAKEIINEIRFGERRFKAWHKGEDNVHRILTIKIPSTYPRTVTAGKFLQAMCLQNKLDTSKFAILDVKEVPASKERILKVRVEHELLTTLAQKPMYLAAGKVSIFYRKSKLN